MTYNWFEYDPQMTVKKFIYENLDWKYSEDYPEKVICWDTEKLFDYLIQQDMLVKQQMTECYEVYLDENN